MTYKYEGFSVGDVIQSDDFEPRMGRGSCYIEGAVTSICKDGVPGRPYAHYVIKVTHDVWDGAEQSGDASRVGDIGYVPMQCLFHDWHNRVRKVEQCAKVKE